MLNPAVSNGKMLCEVTHLFAICILCVGLKALDIYETGSRHIDCKKSKIDRNVTLASGKGAGQFFKANSSVNTMKQCIAQCCRMKGCDIAFFSNKACYSVKCKSLDSCAPTKNEDQTKDIEISYVARPSSTRLLEASKTGEPALEDELVSEFINENPFFEEKDNNEGLGDDSMKILYPHNRSLREWKDLIMAIVCGFVATAVGVAGVVMMTRRLTENEEFDYVMNDRVDLSDKESEEGSDNNNEATSSYERASVPRSQN